LANTLIIITSDNGPWFEGSAGGRGRKGTTFEGGMHVPFIAYWQGHVVPVSSSTPAIGTDILPTILDYLGLPLPQDRQIDGVSLRRLFEGEDHLSERPIYFFARDKLIALRQGDFKYQNRKMLTYSVDSAIAVPTPKGPWLFNLIKDPDESYNLMAPEDVPTQPLTHQMSDATEQFAKNPRGWR